MGAGVRMSAEGSIELDWGDTLQCKFRLAYGELRELQEKVNKPRVAIGVAPVGPRGLLRAFIAGDEWADDAREVIRLGLIGGGMKPVDALHAVKQYVEGRPLAEGVPVATTILMAAVVGVADDPVGKSLAGEAETVGTMAPSPSPRSTASAPH